MFWARAPAEKTVPWRGKRWLGRGLSQGSAAVASGVSRRSFAALPPGACLLSAGSAVSPGLPDEAPLCRWGEGWLQPPGTIQSSGTSISPGCFRACMCTCRSPAVTHDSPKRRSSLRWGQTARPRYPQPPSICVKRAAGTLRAWAHQPCPEQCQLIGLPQQSPALTQSPGASSPRTFWNTQLYHGLRSSTRQPPPSASRSLATSRSRQM